MHIYQLLNKLSLHNLVFIQVTDFGLEYLFRRTAEYKIQNDTHL